jgi:hypothetical protein
MSKNRDPLGLTLPPPDMSHRFNIVPGHTPKDADEPGKGWNVRKPPWKYPFVVYRAKICGNTDREIATMLKQAEHSGDIFCKRNRIRNFTHNGEYCYRYVKFSQQFVDCWPEIARAELTEIHQDEKYAISLLQRYMELLE